MVVFADMQKQFFVYILASQQYGTLYVGITSNLPKRLFEHQQGLVDGFTKQYGVKTLVYYEQTSDAQSAIEREKQLKKWKREWKIQLIEKENAEWKDLANSL